MPHKSRIIPNKTSLLEGQAESENGSVGERHHNNHNTPRVTCHTPPPAALELSARRANAHDARAQHAPCCQDWRGDCRRCAGRYNALMQATTSSPVAELTMVACMSMGNSDIWSPSNDPTCRRGGGGLWYAELGADGGQVPRGRVEGLHVWPKPTSRGSTPDQVRSRPPGSQGPPWPCTHTHETV